MCWPVSLERNSAAQARRLIVSSPEPAQLALGALELRDRVAQRGGAFEHGLLEAVALLPILDLERAPAQRVRDVDARARSA